MPGDASVHLACYCQLTLQTGNKTLDITGLPKWTNVIPTLIGVALAISGMYVLPLLGIRNVWGPILGLPIGLIIGVAILSTVAKRRA